MELITITLFLDALYAFDKSGCKMILIYIWKETSNHSEILFLTLHNVTTILTSIMYHFSMPHTFSHCSIYSSILASAHKNTHIVNYESPLIL